MNCFNNYKTLESELPTAGSGFFTERNPEQDQAEALDQPLAQSNQTKVISDSGNFAVVSVK